MKKSLFGFLIAVATVIIVMTALLPSSIVSASDCPDGTHAVWRLKTPEELAKNPGDLWTWDCVPNTPTPTSTPQQENAAWLQTSVICESRIYDVTVVVTSGEKAKDISDVPMHGLLSDKALDFAVTTVFKNGKPASITFFNVHIPAWNESGCATATPTPSATLTASVTPSETPSATPSASPTPSETPSLTSSPSPTPNCGEEDETQVCTPTVSPTPSTTPSRTPTLKPTLTVTPTPGNPDQGECNVGNSANFPNGASGGFNGGWWNTKEVPMDNGKPGLAVQMFFPDANVAGKKFTITYGDGSQTILVKNLNASSKDRCIVGDDFVAIPFTTAQPLILDMGDGGSEVGPKAGSIQVGDSSFVVNQFDAEGTVSQPLGVAAFVKFASVSIWGVHYMDLQRDLVKGEIVKVTGKSGKVTTYKVDDFWNIEKTEIKNLPKGLYLATCTSDLQKNRIYKLKKG